MLYFQKVVSYHSKAIATRNNTTLNSNHYYFLLVDNGTSGKYGGEILFRKRFERFLLRQTNVHTSRFSKRANMKTERDLFGKINFSIFKLTTQIFLLCVLLSRAEQIQFEWF